MKLLTRITQQVRNQNWFAAFLDFVIDISIAFKSPEWNEKLETAHEAEEDK